MLCEAAVEPVDGILADLGLTPINSSTTTTACRSRSPCRWTCGSIRASRKPPPIWSTNCPKRTSPTSYMNWRRSVIPGESPEKIGDGTGHIADHTTDRLAELVRSAIP